MNVLCSDKTGTLTEGVVQLHSALDPKGLESQKVLQSVSNRMVHGIGYLGLPDRPGHSVPKVLLKKQAREAFTSGHHPGVTGHALVSLDAFRKAF